MQGVPARWRFNFNDDAVSLRDLSWAEAARVFRGAETGDLDGQADGECVSLEFDASHAAVVYMGRDGVIVRPYFPHRAAATQDLAPFFDGCGIRVGPQGDTYRGFSAGRTGSAYSLRYWPDPPYLRSCPTRTPVSACCLDSRSWPRSLQPGAYWSGGRCRQGRADTPREAIWCCVGSGDLGFARQE